jgi:hypothetical protein
MLSHALEDKMIMISKMTAKTLVRGMRVFSKIECDDINVAPFLLCPYCFDILVKRFHCKPCMQK